MKVARKITLTSAFVMCITLACFGQEGNDTLVNLKPLGDTAWLRDSSAFDVVAKFTVETSGRIRSIEILKNNCKNCDDKEKKQINDEVINIIRKNPIAPRKDKNGKPRTTTYIQPIIFLLQEE